MELQYQSVMQLNLYMLLFNRSLVSMTRVPVLRKNICPEFLSASTVWTGQEAGNWGGLDWDLPLLNTLPRPMGDMFWWRAPMVKAVLSPFIFPDHGTKRKRIICIKLNESN